VTAPVIKENKRIALERGLLAIAESAPQAGLRLGSTGSDGAAEGDGETGTSEAGATGQSNILGVYPLVDESNQVAGYVLQLVGNGYGGDMNLLAGYEVDGTLFAAQLMENQETPGLGKKAEDPAYMTKFIGRGGGTPLPHSKNDLSAADVDAVTGATITFMGVANALSSGSEYVIRLGTSR
jgi:electron transport complex protein RnfG